MPGPLPHIAIRRRASVQNEDPLPKRGRCARSEHCYAVDSDLSPDMPISSEELEAVARLLGSDLDRFLFRKT
jgi:hypothetical protein